MIACETIVKVLGCATKGWQRYKTVITNSADLESTRAALIANDVPEGFGTEEHPVLFITRSHPEEQS